MLKRVNLQGVFLVKRVLRSFFVCLIVIFLMEFLPIVAAADENGKAVIVFIDRIGLADISYVDTPNLDLLIAKGTIGLMTTNTGGSRSQKDAYITMGAGARAVGSDKSPLGLSSLESFQGINAGEYFQQITGINAPSSAVVNLGIARAIRNNLNKPYQVKIGALGTALREANLNIAIIGNCDTPNEYKRYLSSFLMDDKGIVPVGFVDKSYLVDDHSRPFGVRTNYNILNGWVEEVWNTSDLIAIQLGDTSRAEDFRYETSDEMNEHYKKMAIEESDAFVGRLIEKLDLDKDIIMILTPLGPARDLSINNRMTPVIIAGRGYSNGLISSASTKRSGVVTNLDIGATVLSYFDIPHQPGQIGAAIYSTPDKLGLVGLLSFNIKLTEIFNQRLFLLRSYVFAQIIVLIFALITILFKRKFLNYIKICLLFLMSIPMAYLILTLFHQHTLLGSFLVSWVFAIGITAALFVKKLTVMTKIMLLCLATAILILVDQVTGAILIQGSPLGYDVISGARFYGIGNEYMGILIGAVCTGCGAYYDITKNKIVMWPIYILLAFATVILAHPGIGANVGGTISALVAFACLSILFRERRIRLKHFLFVGVFVTLFITGIFIFDSMRAVNSQSHVGQTASLIKQNGIIELVYIIKRKIAMNIKLFRYTIWTRVFLLSLLSVITLIFRPIGVIRDIAEQHPKVTKALAAATIGSITALLVNDSGIVAGATAMIFIAPPIILLVIDQLQKQEIRMVRKDN